IKSKQKSFVSLMPHPCSTAKTAASMPLVTIVNDELKTSDLFWDLIRVKVINSLTEISYILFLQDMG
ncbi:hypothetical protein BI372_06355, partial [Acinetobacter pittii]